MISKEVLGKRLRDVRLRYKLTLKDVEAQSGLSSTHISEIERGMTSPTIGALIRIAHALKKDPSYFIEERELDEICITSESDRPMNGMPPAAANGAVRSEPLTVGVLGGRIRAYELRLESGASTEFRFLREGQDACFYLAEGKGQLRVGSRKMPMAAGDSVHGVLAGVPTLEAAAGGCRMLIIADPKEDAR